jgi:4-hydroxy-tetrahydrodipicolinate synthase
MLHNLYTAITTPFDHENNVDIMCLKKHIMYLLENNSGVVLFGTTGETSTLKKKEKYNILSNLYDVGDKTNFIIGVGGNNTYECIEFCNNLILDGFCNIMITAPYYNKPTQEGLYQHFTTIAKNHYNNCPQGKIMLYNIPGRCVVNIEPKTLKRITDECSNIVAIKEASGDLNQVMSIRNLIPNIKVYSGDDGLIVPIMSVGGVGVVSVVSNIYPKYINEIISLCEKNNYKEAHEKYNYIHNFVKLMFCETNPAPIKYVLYNYNTYNNENIRLPLVKISEENKSKIKDEIDNLHIL